MSRCRSVALLLLLMNTSTQAQAPQRPGSSDDPAGAGAVAAASGVPSGVGAAPGWRLQWGIGAIANPEAAGGDNYNLMPIPYFDARYVDERGTRFFANVGQGLGGYALRWRSTESRRFFNLGAALAPGFVVRDDSIEGLEEVGLATELRMYLEAGSGKWVGSATLAGDIGSGHEGAYLDLAASYRDRLGDRGGFFTVGPVMRLGEEDYQSSLFGVTDREAQDSGLPAYEADSGIERIGVQGLVSLPMGKSPWRWTTIARGSRLMSDAADSPITSEENQFFLLTAFTRPF